MKQSRLESLLESFIHSASGIIVSLCVWMFIITPVWGFESSFFDNLGITAIFAFFGFLRGYVFRRLFNAGIHKQIHKIAKKLSKSVDSEADNE